MRPLLPLLLAAVFLPASAQACRLPSNQTPLLHERLPRPFPAGNIAAEVEIVTDVRSEARPPLEARIIRMMRGHYRGTRLRMEPVVHSSCDGVPGPGTRGIAVGRILSSSDELLVIDPLRAPSRRQVQPLDGPGR